MGVAPGAGSRCERCLEVSYLEADAGGAADGHRGLRPSGDAFRRAIVGRLRAYYAAALELVRAEDPGAAREEHLEWILGPGSNPERDDARLGIRVSELVVLWLEDLASELDGPGSATGARVIGKSRVLAGGRRESAARGLRAATCEFADAFLLGRAAPARP